MPLWGRYLARSPLIQPTRCKLDHFSMLCWNLLPLGCSPSVVNILIPPGSFCKKYFVSQRSHWSPFTILSSMVFGETLAEMSGRHPDGPVSSCRLKHCPLLPTVRALLMLSCGWWIFWLMLSFEQSESLHDFGGLFELCYGDRVGPQRGCSWSAFTDS